MKTYKACSPIETINKVRNILAQIGILTRDSHTDNKIFFSLRTNIAFPDLDLLNYGTNGKGTTFEYAMASAYAEFLERLQNNLLLHKREYGYEKFLKTMDKNSLFIKKIKENNLELDFLFDKSEEYWSSEDVADHFGEELRKMFKLEKNESVKEYIENMRCHDNILMVPFFDVQSSKSQLLPIDYILIASGSNGMCAGNTAKEAIMQGIGEIFERYALKEIYLKELTPPTIPDEFFEGTVAYDKLIFLKENHKYEIIVKDCSLGIGLPVIGIIITDQENQYFNFKLGSDFNLSIALERCLNEVHQGMPGSYFKSTPFKFFNKKDKPDFSSEIDYTYTNLRHIFVDSTGYWPSSLLQSKPSYAFSALDERLGECDDFDYKYSIELIHKLGHNIYIRDNSTLGFPTYYIVVPGMSEIIIGKTNPLIMNVKNDMIALARIKSLTTEEVGVLADKIDRNYDLLVFNKFDYTKLYIPVNDPDLLELDLELLLFMLFYYTYKYQRAKYYIDLFLSNKTREEYQYYFAISDYMDLRYENNIDKEEVVNILSIGYGEDIAREVGDDLADPSKIFQYYNFPNCFDCENCEVLDKCRLFEILQIEKNIDIHSRCINQEDLKNEL